MKPVRPCPSASRLSRWPGALALVVLAACPGDARPPDGETPAPTVATATGEQLYQQRCASCHQPDGQGIAGNFPPLAGGEHAIAANVAVPILIEINGLQGRITVRGQEYDGIMVPYGLGVEMSDEEVAAVLTYVRTSWGNQASPVTPQDVARVRQMPRTGTGPMTAEELRPLM